MRSWMARSFARASRCPDYRAVDPGAAGPGQAPLGGELPEIMRDTLTVQNQVARAIAGEIRIEVTPRERAALKTAKIINPEAYEAYHKGRYSWNLRTAVGLEKSVEYFNESIAKDPNYAVAYSRTG